MGSFYFASKIRIGDKLFEIEDKGSGIEDKPFKIVDKFKNRR